MNPPPPPPPPDPSGQSQSDGTAAPAGAAIVNECELPASPGNVWRALTEARLLEAWLLPNDIRPEQGTKFSLTAPAGAAGNRIDCQILEAQPQRLLRYSWCIVEGGPGAEGHPVLHTTVTFELFPTITGGTLLRVTHAGFPSATSRTVALHAASGAMVASFPAMLRRAA